jgi:uncharacterized protein YjaG (DUF416 family)
VKFNFEEDDTPNFCHDCSQQFENSFELIDHALEDDEDFDPYYILPNGFKLLLGSLLRFMYNNADEPEKIKLISQSTFVTLFAGEMGYDLIDELVEDMVVKSALQDFDKSLEELLSGDKDEEGGA